MYLQLTPKKKVMNPHHLVMIVILLDQEKQKIREREDVECLLRHLDHLLNPHNLKKMSNTKSIQREIEIQKNNK